MGEDPSYPWIFRERAARQKCDDSARAVERLLHQQREAPIAFGLHAESAQGDAGMTECNCATSIQEIEYRLEIGLADPSGLAARHQVDPRRSGQAERTIDFPQAGEIGRAHV